MWPSANECAPVVLFMSCADKDEAGGLQWQVSLDRIGKGGTGNDNLRRPQKRPAAHTALPFVNCSLPILLRGIFTVDLDKCGALCDSPQRPYEAKPVALTVPPVVDQVALQLYINASSVLSAALLRSRAVDNQLYLPGGR